MLVNKDLNFTLQIARTSWIEAKLSADDRGLIQVPPSVTHSSPTAIDAKLHPSGIADTVGQTNISSLTLKCGVSN